ncbi:MAG: tetratricopeptide repeat protein [Pseudomonadota bacterium]
MPAKSSDALDWLENQWLARDLDAMRDWLDGLAGERADQGDALLTQARLARVAGDRDQASALLEQAILNSDDDPLLRARLLFERAAWSLDLLDESGRFSSLRIARAVRDDFEQAHQLDPDYARAQMGLMQFHLNAPAIAGGRDDRAELMKTLLAESAPDELTVFEAERLVADGDAVAAIPMLEALGDRAVLSDPHWVVVQSQLLLAQGRIEQSISLMEQALQHFPLHAGLWFERGRVAAETGQNPARGLEAMLQYQALPHWPEDPAPDVTWWRIGQLQLALGRREGAVEAWRYVLALNPSFEPAQQALSALEPQDLD